MITPPNGVKRKFNNILEDEVEELFAKEIKQVQHLMKADDGPSDEIADREDNVADNDHMTGKGESTEEEDTAHGEISIIVKLADVCTDNDDDELKKYTKFIDDMGALLLNYKPSNKLMPMYLNMQGKYIKAQQTVKEKLASKGNKEPQKQRVNEMEQEEQEDEYINVFDFLDNFQC